MNKKEIRKEYLDKSFVSLTSSTKATLIEKFNELTQEVVTMTHDWCLFDCPYPEMYKNQKFEILKFDEYPVDKVKLEVSNNGFAYLDTNGEYIDDYREVKFKDVLFYKIDGDIVYTIEKYDNDLLVMKYFN